MNQEVFLPNQKTSSPTAPQWRNIPLILPKTSTDQPTTTSISASEIFANLTLPRTQSSALVVEKNNQALGTTNSPTADILTGLGVLVTVAAQVWYIKQIRAGTAAKNAVSMGLNGANDALLCGAAIATAQGPAAVAVMGTYAVMDILTTIEIYKKDRSLNFKPTDWLCISGCVLGWSALLNILPKFAQGGMTQQQLDFSASVTASLVNIFAISPLLRDACFGKIAPADTIVKPSTTSAIAARVLQPALPWLLDLSAYTIALALAPKNTLEQWLQPAAVLGIGIVSAAATMVLGWRRMLSR